MKTNAMIAIALAGAATAASAQSITWMPNIENFGADSLTGSGADVLVWSETFSFTDVVSFDSLSLDLAHDYAGDLALRIIDNGTGDEFYLMGSADTVNGVSSLFDADHLGDGVDFLLANTVNYTLVGSGAASEFVTDTSGDVAGGTYNASEWAAGGSGSFTIELWDTWGNVDGGSLGSVVLNYTVVPAPASAALLGLGGLVAVRRRR